VGAAGELDSVLPGERRGDQVAMQADVCDQEDTHERLSSACESGRSASLAIRLDCL
jgi:hypothetical protein